MNALMLEIFAFEMFQDFTVLGFPTNFTSHISSFFTALLVL